MTTPDQPARARTGWWRMMVGSRDEASCWEVARALQSALDGGLDDAGARRVARHLELCRRCGLEADTYTAIKATLSRGGREVDPDTVARLREFGAGLVEVDPGAG
ncbi:MAG: zf-HC2 domain-containing protein [Sporichthyaceae bacterium]